MNLELDSDGPIGFVIESFSHSPRLPAGASSDVSSRVGKLFDW